MLGETTLRAACLALSERVYSHARQRFEKVIKYTIGVPIIAGGEAAPEAPAYTFENSRPPHILPPLLRTRETIAVAFNSQAPSIRTLDDHINSITDGPDL